MRLVASVTGPSGCFSGTSGGQGLQVFSQRLIRAPREELSRILPLGTVLAAGFLEGECRRQLWVSIQVVNLLIPLLQRPFVSLPPKCKPSFSVPVGVGKGSLVGLTWGGKQRGHQTASLASHRPSCFQPHRFSPPTPQLAGRLTAYTSLSSFQNSFVFFFFLIKTFY